MSILEKYNPQKFLISLFLCVIRGELFYHRDAMLLVISAKCLIQ